MLEWLDFRKWFSNEKIANEEVSDVRATTRRKTGRVLDGCIAVHRWFENGEGWSFDTNFEGSWPIIEALDECLKSNDKLPFQFEVPFQDGYLIGERVSDNNCPDELARHRGPSITRVAYSPTKLIGKHRERFLQLLRSFPLPNEGGQGNFKLPLKK